MLFIVLFAELSAHQTEVINFYCHFIHILPLFFTSFVDYEEENVPIKWIIN